MGDARYSLLVSSDSSNHNEQNLEEGLFPRRVRRTSVTSVSSVDRISKGQKYLYQDFDTIDWLKDVTHCGAENMRAHSRGVLRFSWKTRILKYWDAGTGWVVVTLVGFILGIVACLLSVTTMLLTDLRMGVCSTGFFMNKRECDWISTLPYVVANITRPYQTFEQMFTKVGLSGSIAYGLNYIIYVISGLAMACTSAYIVKSLAPYASGSGIAEIKTILGGFIIYGYLGFFTAIVKCVATILAVSSGLSVGYESPMVHIGAATANLVTRLFPKYRRDEAKKRETISAGAAAGISVAFNAPISGLLFSFEEASFYFSFKTLWRTFWCTLVAAFVRYQLYYSWDSGILQSTSTSQTWRLIELIPFAFIGLSGAIFGSFYIKSAFFLTKLHKNTRLGNYPITEVFFVTLFTAVISFLTPVTRVSNHYLLSRLIHVCTEPESPHTMVCLNYPLSYLDNDVLKNLHLGPIIGSGELILAFGLKTAFLLLSSCLKIPSGFIFPVMVIGALYGRIISSLLHFLSMKYKDTIFGSLYSQNIHDKCCINPLLYAIIGAAAFLGGSTHMTVTLVVMIVELTHGTAYIVPIMVAVMVSKLIGKFIVSQNMVQNSIQINNYPYLDVCDAGKYLEETARHILDFKASRGGSLKKLLVLTEFNMKLFDICFMTTHIHVSPDLLISVLDQLLESSFYCYPVVEDYNSMTLIGFVTSYDLLNRLAKYSEDETAPTMMVTLGSRDFSHTNNQEVIDFSSIVHKTPCVVSPDILIDVLIQYFERLGLRSVFVTNNGKLIDIITKKDLLSYIKNK